MTPGAMRDRYVLSRRALDANGDATGAWEDVTTLAAQTEFLRGTEAVQAARLEGEQPVVVTLRACAATRAIDNAWKLRDARDATRVFDVTAAEITPDRAWVQVLAIFKRGQADV